MIGLFRILDVLMMMGNYRDMYMSTCAKMVLGLGLVQVLVCKRLLSQRYL